MNNWIISGPEMNDDGFIFVRLECPRCGWAVNHEAEVQDDIGFWNYCPRCGEHNHEEVTNA